MFNNFMAQRLELIKRNSKTFKNIPASVQEKIYINDIKLPVEEGDIFEHVLPSGLKQRLLVTRVVLYNTGSPLDHYEIEYVKE